MAAHWPDMLSRAADACLADPSAPSRRAGRVGILTFHRCINYGSYWQARCLAEGLRARGSDAVLLDHHCPRVNRSEWRCAFQPLLPQRTARADFAAYRRKARRLIEAIAALPLSRPFQLDAPEAIEPLDLAVVGSDEVWNMEHPWYGQREIFYGTGLPAKRIVSYAASFGSQDARWGLHPWWADKLKGFSALSVRDENSRAMVANATGIAPELVLDPCLQFPPPPLADAASAEKPGYVAVYGHSFPSWYADQIRDWARRRGLSLVSIGYRNDWADSHEIDAGPEDFRRLIARSSAVATNFFHGCVFALLAARPLACVASSYRLNKLHDLLSSLGAQERLVEDDTSPATFDRLLSSPLSHTVFERLAALRARSEHFLAHALA